MKLHQLAVVVIIAFAVGCARNDSKRAAEEARGPASSAASSSEHDEKGFLHIEPEMLRDLKITTAQVERRSGGEGSMLLGELRVNEDAYAEVGAPVPSRILAL